MSLADAILLAAATGGLCAGVAFVLTMWLADRETRRLSEALTARTTTNADLRWDNERLCKQLQRAGMDRMALEQHLNHALAERDVFVEDNQRMHRTLRRQIGTIRQLRESA